MGKASRRKKAARQATGAQRGTKPLEMACTNCGRKTNNAEVSAHGGCPGCGSVNFQIGEPEYFGDWDRG